MLKFDCPTWFFIVDNTHAVWPGRLPYRTVTSARGYATREDAENRVRRVNAHYNGKFGCSPGDLRILELPR